MRRITYFWPDRKSVPLLRWCDRLEEEQDIDLRESEGAMAHNLLAPWAKRVPDAPYPHGGRATRLGHLAQNKAD